MFANHYFKLGRLWADLMSVLATWSTPLLGFGIFILVGYLTYCRLIIFGDYDDVE